MFPRSAFLREARPFVAILLAYAIAAQVLIAGALGGQIAAAGPDAGSIPICYGASVPAADPDSPGAPPVRDVPCTLCASALCAPAVTAAAAVEFPLRLVRTRAATLPSKAIEGVPATKSRFSRGPPAIA